ncbi:MAG: helix-turn-helix domain-containing protein [Ilumatobacteraceae bacterium]
MVVLDPLGGSHDGLPEMLTVAQAAHELQLGRTLMYRLTARYLAGEPDGVPAVRLGGCVRVPRAALIEFVRTGACPSHRPLAADIAAIVDEMVGPPPAQPSDPSTEGPAVVGPLQLSASSGVPARVRASSSLGAPPPVQLSLLAES